MKTMAAGKFKARCLRVMEDVKKYRTSVVITKKGRPVAKLVPPDAPASDIIGCMVGTARIIGDVEAPILPLAAWAAVAAGRALRRPRARAARRKP